MKCLIVDDEPLARSLLEKYIARVDGLTLVKSAENAVEAFGIIQRMPIDLVFLDIQMPQVTGIELLKSLRQRPRVILTTAYRDYAFEAYDLDVADYLLKPISFERFLRAISKVYQLKQHIEPADDSLTGVQTFNEAYIYLKEDREMIKVFLKDIIYIEGMRDYVRVRTHDRQIVTYQKISYLEQKLPESKFIRVHRSFIVAYDKISAFTATTVRVGETDVPIGRIYKNETLKALHRNNVLNEAR